MLRASLMTRSREFSTHLLRKVFHSGFPPDVTVFLHYFIKKISVVSNVNDVAIFTQHFVRIFYKSWSIEMETNVLVLDIPLFYAQTLASEIAQR